MKTIISKFLVISILIVILFIVLNNRLSLEPFTLQGDFDNNKSKLESKIRQLNVLSNLRFRQADPNKSHLVDLEEKMRSYNKNNVLNNPLENNKIKIMETQMKELNNILLKRNINKSIFEKHQGIKSMNNGADLSLIPVKSNKYAVRMNNGCLSVSNNGYDINECNINNPSQHFSLKKIFNEFTYANNVENQDFIENKNGISYPFSLLKSDVNNNCLTNNNNNMRLMPCNMLESQRWKSLDEPVCNTN